jgi:hypothetical protein
MTRVCVLWCCVRSQGCDRSGVWSSAVLNTLLYVRPWMGVRAADLHPHTPHTITTSILASYPRMHSLLTSLRVLSRGRPSTALRMVRDLKFLPYTAHAPLYLVPLAPHRHRTDSPSTSRRTERNISHTVHAFHGLAPESRHEELYRLKVFSQNLKYIEVGHSAVPLL